MRQTDRKKYYSAGFMLLIGALTVYGSINYSLGTLARMGPGYFPLLLGGVLVFVGALIMVVPQAVDDSQDDEEIEPEPLQPISRMQHLRPIAAVVLAMLAFLVLGKYGGLVPATFILILLASLGDRDNSLKAAVLLATGVTVCAVAVFSYGMQMQFPLFSWG